MQVSRITWAGYVVGTGERRGTYRILVGKPERMRPLERAGGRYDDNIKMDLKATQWDGVDELT
jgi:hypothetical protein